jgi:hypothetical protein
MVRWWVVDKEWVGHSFDSDGINIQYNVDRFPLLLLLLLLG